MRNIRIWFKKDFECRYISHLDLNRTMLRALHKSKLPIWHTEGFNPHPFATFPLPLSLGFRGVNECMDVKLEDDSLDLKAIPDMLNPCLPRGIQVFDATEVIMKAGKVAYASFTMLISNDKIPSGRICKDLKELFAGEILLQCIGQRRRRSVVVGTVQYDKRRTAENFDPRRKNGPGDTLRKIPVGYMITYLF